MILADDGIARELADSISEPAADNAMQFAEPAKEIITETSRIVTESFIPTFTQQPVFYFILGFLTLALSIYIIKLIKKN